MSAGAQGDSGGPARSPRVDDEPRASPAVVALVLLATAVALAPWAGAPWSLAALRRDHELPGVLALLAWALPVVVLAACWRWLPLDLDRRRRRDLFVLVVVLAVVQVHLHFTEVDRRDFVYAARSFEEGNTGWQRLMQAAVLEGRTERPFWGHNARVLPNGFTQWLALATGDYAPARTVYRLTFQPLLLLAIYVLARRWFSHATALGGVLFYSLIYAVSIRLYAGQLTDPMSHLSLVLGMALLVRGPFPYLLLCLGVGAIAKETVAVLAPLYFVTRPDDPRRVPRTAALLAVGLGVVWLLRWRVMGGMSEEGMSATTWAHVKANWAEWPLWWPQVALTLGPGLVFLAAAWRRCPRDLRWLCGWLTLVLLASSLRFSWMREARNFVPAAIPLGIVAAAWLLGDLPDAHARPHEGDRPRGMAPGSDAGA